MSNVNTVFSTIFGQVGNLLKGTSESPKINEIDFTLRIHPLPDS